LEARLRVFSQAWNVVNERFFDASFNGVDWRQMRAKYQPAVESAKDKIQLANVLQEMLDELHVSHMQISSDLYYGTGLSSLRGPVQNPVLVGGQWVMRQPTAGSAARQAGVQRGWILKLWNDRPYGPDVKTACDIDEIVRLQFQDLAGGERTLAVRCGVLDSTKHPPAMISRGLPDGLRYVHFSNFRREVKSWLAAEIRANASAPALVVDLRGNGGGDLDVVQYCLNLLHEKPRVIGEFQGRKGKPFVLKVSGSGARAYRGRVFVLIDEASGSGSEVLAAAVQESRRGTVVGRVSVGGVLQGTQYNLAHGFTLDVARGDYHTVQGVRLEGRGVTPDELVQVTMKDYLEDRDPDLERVRELWQQR